ncbi:MAG: indole-3-glycerol phosphate synthase TrpC [Acetobacteraceae bacterium]|nr:indole-3-glycerol phosphate synthase TrpC [Acetobacteraceae bacterium]
MAQTTSDDMLARICADTRAETARRMAATSVEDLRDQIAHATDEPRGFGRALMAACVRDGFGLIAEIKKASPSGGLICADFDPTALAMAYQLGGAACLSVLTDTPYFQGSLPHLRAAHAAVDLPVLRKDFILDPWQIYESRAAGADCILLIMAALTDVEARDLEELARALDLDVLVEVHDAEELQRALGLQTKLIGINNRSLKTLTTDLATTFTLAADVPPDRFLISESGIRSNDDVKKLVAVGAHGFLVGEHLMRQADVTGATHTLLGRT